MERRGFLKLLGVGAAGAAAVGAGVTKVAAASRVFDGPVPEILDGEIVPEVEVIGSGADGKIEYKRLGKETFPWHLCIVATTWAGEKFETVIPFTGDKVQVHAPSDWKYVNSFWVEYACEKTTQPKASPEVTFTMGDAYERSRKIGVQAKHLATSVTVKPDARPVPSFTDRGGPDAIPGANERPIPRRPNKPRGFA